MNGDEPDRSEPAANGARHPGGRPRLPATDRAILEAVGDLIAEQGLRGTTINAVAARSGVARGTVYRRFPNRDAMLAAAMRDWRGRDPEPLGDDIEANLRTHVEESRVVLDEPSFRAMLPALAEIQLSGESDDTVRSIVFPQREAMARCTGSSRRPAASAPTSRRSSPTTSSSGPSSTACCTAAGSPTRTRRRRSSTSCSTGSGFASRARSSLVPRTACGVDDNAPMHLIAVIAAVVAALIHVWFFVLESLQFDQPKVFGRFGITSAEDAAIVRPMAFNQGFYNLFLALGILAGLGLVASRPGRRGAGGRPVRLRVHGRGRAPCSWRRTAGS